MTDDRSIDDSTATSPKAEPFGAKRFFLAWRSSTRWQFPVAIASLVAIGAAILLHGDRQVPVVDPATSLSAARFSLDLGDLDSAALRLAEVEAGLADHPSLLGEYHLLVADHRARSVAPVLSAPSELARQVAEAYGRAVADGAVLDHGRLLVSAEAMVASGDRDAALVRLDRIASEDDPGTDPQFVVRVTSLRQSLRRDVIEEMVVRGDPSAEVRRELGILLADDVDVELDAWSVGLDARLRLDSGDVEGLAHGLVFQMRRLEGRLEEPRDPMVSIEWPRLWVLLGHAYRDELRLGGRAMECYEVALDRLDAMGPVAVEASLSLAGLELSMARLELRPEQHALELEKAFGHYEDVVSSPDSTLGQQVSAGIGKGLVRILQDDHQAALEHLRKAATSTIVFRDQQAAICKEAVLVAMEGAERAGAVAMREEGIEGVELCDSVVEYGDLIGQFTADVGLRRRGLELVAEARERSAGLILLPHLGDDDPRVERAMVMVPVDVRLEAARRFAAAAIAMDEVEIDMGWDDPNRFHALWRAATLYDKAGAIQPSLVRYIRFVESQSGDSSLWPEAVYRVAAAHHSLRSLGEAEEWYRKLLEGMGGGRDEVSEFTTRAKVGLARVLMEQGGESAIPEAESLLNGVLSGTAKDAIEPSVPEYRDALLQLVRLLASAGRWSEVAGRGDEWLRRYGDDPRWGEVAVRTGRAFLKHADRLMDEGAGRAVDMKVASERSRALVMAATRLGEAVDRLGARTVDGLDPLEARLLRAACVDRAVVADRRGDLAEAVRLHRETERRFAGEPIAIIALVMMSDAADRAGDARTAAAATDRARKRLQHLHRSGDAMSAGIADLGPELVFGPGDETLRRWISAFPPGLGVAIGEEGGVQ